MAGSPIHGLAWIAKVDDKLATFKASQASDDDDGWSDVDEVKY